MKTAVFIYNFPNKKTQDFLVRLTLAGVKPDLVIASPPVDLALPKTFLRDKYRHIDLMDPEKLCRSLDLKYIESSHDSEDTVRVLEELRPDLGVIASARILRKQVIGLFKLGILNFHPGLIPDNRGLNAAKWAIVRDIPQGMTVHLIDNRVDAGRIIKRFVVPVYSDDNIRDMNLRIYETQVSELVSSVESVFRGECNYQDVPLDKKGHHGPANEELDKLVLEKFNQYREKWAFDKHGWMCGCGEKLTFKSDKAECRKCSKTYTKDGERVQRV
jgi:folate-dependent phosphoribosylglycinamide formyltransferase PurN